MTPWTERSTGHFRKLMVFVDGTNLLCEISRQFQIRFRVEKPPLSAFSLARHLIDSTDIGPDHTRVRDYWFASYQGSDEDHLRISKALRAVKFEPVLFQRRNGREKGVDIALTKEMLVNAFNQNFEVGLLVAGDEDYTGLVNEVKRYGPILKGAFFDNAITDPLRLAFDRFHILGKPLDAKVRDADIEKIKHELAKH